jgi:hypothetical protein
MSLFSKFFGSSNLSSDEEKETEFSKPFTENNTAIDELFIHNFKKNGGKFLYCDTKDLYLKLKSLLECMREVDSSNFSSLVAHYDWSVMAPRYDERMTRMLA